MKVFLITEAMCLALQLLLFVPFYFMWQGDCKKYGKKNLAVPLSERFFNWLIFFPFWLIPIICFVRGE